MDNELDRLGAEARSAMALPPRLTIGEIGRRGSRRRRRHRAVVGTATVLVLAVSVGAGALALDRPVPTTTAGEAPAAPDPTPPPTDAPPTSSSSSPEDTVPPATDVPPPPDPTEPTTDAPLPMPAVPNAPAPPPDGRPVQNTPPPPAAQPAPQLWPPAALTVLNPMDEREPWPSAGISGTLVLENGCVFIHTDRGAQHLTVWKAGHWLDTSGPVPVVRAANGSVAATAGHPVRLGGGGYAGSQIDQLPLARLQRHCVTPTVWLTSGSY